VAECVCVCVCVREREREREKEKERVAAIWPEYLLIIWISVVQYSIMNV